jgi:hypothetical protein
VNIFRCKNLSLSRYVEAGTQGWRVNENRRSFFCLKSIFDIFRSKVQEKINLLEKFGIPMVIFSAGVGNAIEIILKNELEDFPKNGHLISNMLYFNEEVDGQV